MPFIEWLFVIYFGLDLLASVYYYSQDGYTTSPGVYILSVLVDVSSIVFLLLSGPLTWFGWVLVALFVYSLVVSVAKLTSGRHTKVKTRGDIALSATVSTLVLIGILTVGVLV